MPKYKKIFFLENIRKSYFPKYKKNFFLEKLKTFFKSWFFRKKCIIFFSQKNLRAGAGNCVR